MGQIALGVAGATIGAFFGDPMLGFSAGMAAGGLLFPEQQKTGSRPLLSDLRVTGSQYGAVIPQIYGQFRIPGNLIWATDLVPHKVKRSVGKSHQTVTNYTYTVSCAIAICRGPIGRVVQILAENTVIYDQSAGSFGDEVQQISVGTNTGGAFTVTFRGATSASIAWNATTATVQGALESLSTIGVGNILVTGPSGGPWTCTFQGALAGENVPRMDMSNHTLTGGSGDGITTVTQGGSVYNITIYPGNETQTPDPFIVSKQGSSPGYRGLAYVVIQDLDLSRWGNRLPVFTFIVDAGSGVNVSVGSVLADVFGQCGLSPSQYDVSAATTFIQGFVINQRRTVAQQIAELLRAYSYELTEIDGKIKVVPLGSASQVTVPSGDLGAISVDQNAGPLLTPSPTTGTLNGSQNTQAAGTARVMTKRMHDLELPQRLELSYFSKTALYNVVTRAAIRYIKTHTNKGSLNFPLVLNDTTARQVVEMLLYRMWVERESFQFVLPLKYMLYAPTDVITLPVGSQSLRVRLQKVDISLFGPVACTAVLDDLTILTQGQTSDDPQATVLQVVEDDTTLLVFSTNALSDADATSSGFYLAAAGKESGVWTGCAVYWSRDGGTTYQALTSVIAPVSYGAVTGTVPAPPANVNTARWDTTTTITVTMTSGVPNTTSDSDVLGGANMALIGQEVVQFATATPTGNPNEYTLSRLLRGQRGTDAYWSSHTAGETFIILDTDTVVRQSLDESLRGKSIFLKAVAATGTVATADPVSLTITGEEWTCYSPCDVFGSRDGSNNLTVVWKRRTRSGGEMRDLHDVDDPDAPDSYDVDILSGLTVVRTFAALSSATVTYTAANQVTDGFTPGNPVTLVVYQNGKYGRGYPATATV